MTSANSPDLRLPSFKDIGSRGRRWVTARTSWLFAFAASCAVVAGSGPGAVAQVLTVGSEQKVSATAGTALGGLVDLGFVPGIQSEFGSAVVEVGDLDGDGVPDLAVASQRECDTTGALYILFMNDSGSAAGPGTVKDFKKTPANAGCLPPELPGDLDGDGVRELDPGDQFGTSIANLGDLDGDGVADLAVGATGDDDGGPGNNSRGAVWILFLNDHTSPDGAGTLKGFQKISQTQGLDTSSDPSLDLGLQPGDIFGGSGMATVGDLSGDGVTDLAVGAASVSDGDPRSGAVYVLFLNDQSSAAGAGTVHGFRKISQAEPSFGNLLDALDFFGFGVASAGDLDGDGVTDLAVGALGDDDGGFDKGAVWILFLNEESPATAAGTVKGVQKISTLEGGLTETLENSSLFGINVANIGDRDGDGVTDIAVGAVNDSNGGAGAGRGAVFVLYLNGPGSAQGPGTVKDSQKISSVDSGFSGVIDNDDNFGRAIASISDLDGNSVADLAVGTYRDDDGAFDAGALWVLFLDGPPQAPIADAGPDQTVDEGDLVALDGTGSSDPQGDPLTYGWSQVAGPAVVLDDATSATPSFTAPFVSANETLTFELVVDDGTEVSEPDTVDVTVVNANNPPVSDAGEDSTIKEGAVGTLDGSNSFDPEGDAIAFAWTQLAGPPVVLQPSANVVQPSFVAPVAAGQSLVFQLEVSDGKESNAPTSYPPDPGQPDDDIVSVEIVLNSPPVADAGPDQTRDEGSVVQLDGSGSSDPDGGDALSFQWSQLGGTPVVLDDPTAASPSFDAPPVAPGGEDLIFRLTVTDDDPVNPLSSAPDGVVIHLRNINDPPSCALAAADPDSLWPPNHKMKPVGIVGVSDADSVYNTVTLAVTGVTQDEPVNGQGDGDSSPDAVIQDGDPADSVLLRAERAGGGNGRVYVIGFTADDGFESCDGAVRVTVPKSRKSTAIDDGQHYDSTLP